MAYVLGFVGAGNMAEAIARGAAQQGVVEAAAMVAADPSADRLAVFRGFGVASADDNAALIRSADSVLLAVKPQSLPELAESLEAIDVERQVVISIMAGASCETIQKTIGKPARVVRVLSLIHI